MFEYQEELISEFYDKSGRYLGRWFILHAPETGGDKAFELLRQAMKQENKIAVAKTVMGQKGMLLAVIPTDGGILIETVFYADEIKELPKEYSYPEVNEAELAMAKTLINSMNQEFQPELYKDEYQERLKALIEQKIAGKEIVSAKQEEQSNVIDLMEALKASIEQTSTNPNAAAGAKSERRFLMNILGNKSLKPMLIGADSEPFDDPSYLFELKLDSERCLSYLNKDSTELRNMRLLPKFPELSQLHRQVKKNCILDGELAVIKDGKPNFFEVQRRSLLSNQFKTRLAFSSSPACFTAFDILYLDGKPVMDAPLAEHKKLLGKIVRENQYLAVSRFIEEKGSAFYHLAEQNTLEGIVAKQIPAGYQNQGLG